MENNTRNYVYIYLDQTRSGRWEFRNLVFEFEPFYVGIGVNGRMNTHLCPSELKKDTAKSARMRDIISATGEKPVHFKIFEKLTISDASDIEIEVIKKFKRADIDDGILLNKTDGGTRGKRPQPPTENQLKAVLGRKGLGKIVERRDMDEKILGVWSSAKAAAEETGFSTYCIREKCSAGGKYKNSTWRYLGRSYTPKIKEVKRIIRKIFQYTLNGKFIRMFESAFHAERLTDISRSDLYAALKKKKVFQAGGFQWFWEKFDKVEPVIIQDPKNRIEAVRRPILQYSEQNELVGNYESISAASRATGVNISAIHVGANKNKLKHGFYWKYGEKQALTH